MAWQKKTKDMSKRINKSELFKTAWATAKKFVAERGYSLRVAFSEALSWAWACAKKDVETGDEKSALIEFAKTAKWDDLMSAVKGINAQKMAGTKWAHANDYVQNNAAEFIEAVQSLAKATRPVIADICESILEFGSCTDNQAKSVVKFCWSLRYA